ncbi:hypothetical protein LX74_01169 [Elizabethkingia miricola]|uniref:Uncharacterized protein n=1 Tax=Elizabethkingia miricola TaxID=172045 RepID=A0ABY3NIY8_ELIMR|nr:hypothetical protein LX74_01169 [Elizabethkingia miricola]
MKEKIHFSLFGDKYTFSKEMNQIIEINLQKLYYFVRKHLDK